MAIMTFPHSRWHGFASSLERCGESLPERETDRAARWYRKAVEYLPSYVKARVHLAEIHLSCDQDGDAEALLVPAIASGDPEVRWRLADVMTATGRPAAADEQLEAARRGLEVLLGKHLLAFADHGAEFYAGSGNNPRRAFELASINVANRPTLRAFAQTHATAIAADELRAASEILAAAENAMGWNRRVPSIAAGGNWKSDGAAT